MKQKRFRSEDWLNFGLTRLAEGGVDALRLQDMCAAAGRTIGSFYHHFADQDAFFDALMAHWQRISSTEVIAALEAIPDEDLDAARLAVVARMMDQAIDIGVRRFSFSNPVAAKAVAAVDEQRIGFLIRLYQRRYALPEGEARRFAELEYAAFVGTQIVWPHGTLSHGEAQSNLFTRLVHGFIDADKV